VDALAAVFIGRYAKRKQKSWRETERVFLKEVNPAFGQKRVQDVSRSDVIRLLDEVAERGPIMANRTLAYIRRFFNWCLERGHLSESPCAGIKPPGKTRSRERTLSDQELAEVWAAAETIGGLWGPLVKTLLLTAQRRNEVAGMHWSEIDLDQAIWTIPAERAKNKRAHEVPLASAVMATLTALPRFGLKSSGENSAHSEFVFTTTGRTPVSGFSKAKALIDRQILAARKAADPEAEPLPHWTFHDLRRTATTGMARLGVPPHIADAILNHKEGTIHGVAAVYNRYAYLEERRRALEAWEEHVLAAVSSVQAVSQAG
jgi:integrase